MSVERFGLLAGVGLITLALTPPIGNAAEIFMTVHMVQHLVLLQIAPLLLVSGWAGPDTGSTAHLRWWGARHRVAVSWVAGVAAMTFWYAPPLFEWMMNNPLHHRAAQATLVFAGLLFWSPVVSRSADRRLAPGPTIAYLFTACLASTLTGASIAFAAPGLYRGHAASARDQQIAGLVMWLPCCVVYVGAITTTLARWYGGADDVGDERPRVAPSEA
jgi:putative membrane protein